ncbi:MAG: ORF6N domain-containing protein [Bacilli bacterium]
MNTEMIKKDTIKIEDMIYEVKGKQVMLDSDLAKLYGCKNGTKSLNLAVRRHINRFPERFMFKLTKEEYYNILKFQNETLELEQGKYSKYLPYVFTEQGVAMLATILKTDVAEKVSIRIMDAFVTMRKYLGTNNYSERISNLEMKYISLDNNVRLIQKSLDELSSKEENNHIFFDNQIYDAYSLLINILSKAKKEIIIIDNYAGKKLFDIIKDIKVNIKVYTENIDDIAKEKYELQYHNLTIVNTDIFHDRFIMIDKKIMYHCGASFKDLGKKCFCISKIEDEQIIKDLIIRLGDSG